MYHTVSTTKRGTRDDSASPPPERRLRKSKSGEFLHSMRRKVSLKFGLGRTSTDDSEHPWNPAFHPPTSSLPKRGLLGRAKRSKEEVPPIPPLPSEFELDTEFDEWAMEGIVNRAALYSDGNDASSPVSDLYSSSQSGSGHSGSRYAPPKLLNPFALTSVPHARSPDPIGPTDTSLNHSQEGFKAPPSWAVKPPQQPERDPDEESTSDYGRPSNVADLPQLKMRIYGPDNSDYILRITAEDTVASLTPRLDAKLPPEEERETHELYIRERGGGESSFSKLFDQGD
ncbi:hypothetical protein K438DRAFT_1763701 [Mycena galopus ATCC 62051]|nr:hypothetical protein K438DRAFT_1763701 [Mycena galopus ATCC 62051]